MTLLVAEARARTGAPESLITRFRDHMVEHGLEVAGPLTDSRIVFPGCTALLRLAGPDVALRIEARTPDWLADAKNIVAYHLDAFSPDEPLGIVWTGDGAAGAGARPHNFRALRVVAVRDVTPRMRRLRLVGHDLGRFEAESMHAKILIPPAGQDPVWPRVSPSGQPVFDPGLRRRTYTIRRIDAAAGWLDIDFVLHGDASPGSAFATRAAPGDCLGIMGPGGGAVVPDGWTLVAGDETALPAIARALEEMRPDARGLVLVEVADAAERQDLAHPPGVAVHWLERNGAPYGARLREAVLRTAFPAGEPVTGWAACENLTARAIREHWGETCGLPRARFRAVAYWQNGVGDGEG